MLLPIRLSGTGGANLTSGRIRSGGKVKVQRRAAHSEEADLESAMRAVVHVGVHCAFYARRRCLLTRGHVVFLW